jgi:hypothetical protein
MKSRLEQEQRVNGNLTKTKKADESGKETWDRLDKAVASMFHRTECAVSVSTYMGYTI